MWFQTFEGWSIQLKKTKQNNTNNEKKTKKKQMQPKLSEWQDTSPKWNVFWHFW